MMIEFCRYFLLDYQVTEKVISLDKAQQMRYTRARNNVYN